MSNEVVLSLKALAEELGRGAAVARGFEHPRFRRSTGLREKAAAVEGRLQEHLAPPGSPRREMPDEGEQTQGALFLWPPRRWPQGAEGVGEEAEPPATRERTESGRGGCGGERGPGKIPFPRRTAQCDLPPYRLCLADGLGGPPRARDSGEKEGSRPSG